MAGPRRSSIRQLRRPLPVLLCDGRPLLAYIAAQQRPSGPIPRATASAEYPVNVPTSKARRAPMPRAIISIKDSLIVADLHARGPPVRSRVMSMQRDLYFVGPLEWPEAYSTTALSMTRLSVRATILTFLAFPELQPSRAVDSERLTQSPGHSESTRGTLALSVLLPGPMVSRWGHVFPGQMSSACFDDRWRPDLTAGIR